MMFSNTDIANIGKHIRQSLPAKEPRKTYLTLSEHAGAAFQAAKSSKYTQPKHALYSFLQTSEANNNSLFVNSRFTNRYHTPCLIRSLL